jgi:energy-coupling factor transport system permease protein
MLDPRTKLLLAVAYAAVTALTRKQGWFLEEWAVLVIIIIAMGKFKAYLRWLMMLIPMALFFGAITWWTADRITGQAAALGLMTITTVFFVFFASTEPEDLGNSLVQAGIPFSVAFVMTAALQFVPVVSRKARAVIEAQQARGIILKPGWRALRNYPALLIPLLIQAFQTAESLAEAMEARGFGRSGRSFRKVYRIGVLDWLTVTGGWALATVLILYWVR